MKKTKYTTLIFLIIVQIIIIVILINIIRYRSGNINRTYSSIIYNISRKNLVSTPSGYLKYFYEPKANSIFKEKPVWLENEVTNTINSDSLNERFDYSSSQKPPHTFRIITLGDSFTYGLYVNTPENYSEVLEDLLNKQIPCGNTNKFEVINLGMTGYDAAYSVERFIRRGIKYNADLVILLLKIHNIYGNSDLIYQKLDEYGLNKDRSNVKELWLRAYNEISIGEIKTKTIKYQLSMLDKLRNLYNKNLIIYLLETASQSEKDEIKKVLMPFIQNNNNVYYFESKLNLINSKGVLKDLHPDKKGHIEIALDLENYLFRQKIIKC